MLLQRQSASPELVDKGCMQCFQLLKGDLDMQQLLSPRTCTANVRMRQATRLCWTARDDTEKSKIDHAGHVRMLESLL